MCTVLGAFTLPHLFLSLSNPTLSYSTLTYSTLLYSTLLYSTPPPLRTLPHPPYPTPPPLLGPFRGRLHDPRHGWSDLSSDAASHTPHQSHCVQMCHGATGESPLSITLSTPDHDGVPFTWSIVIDDGDVIFSYHQQQQQSQQQQQQQQHQHVKTESTRQGC